MSEELRTALSTMMAEALDLRLGVKLPAAGSGLIEIEQSLLDVRRRQDRIEELLGNAIRAKARCHRAANHATAAAHDAFDQALQAARSGPVMRGGEYVSAKERQAEANLATMSARIAQRNAEDLHMVCEEAVDLLRLTWRGIDGARQDLLTLIRSAAFESHLER